MILWKTVACRPVYYCAVKKGAKKGEFDEGQILSETDVRKVQGYQEKRGYPDHLREPETQAASRLTGHLRAF